MSHLRQQYESGQISAKKFLEKLFASNEADRTRKKIVKQNEKVRVNFNG